MIFGVRRARLSPEAVGPCVGPESGRVICGTGAVAGDLVRRLAATTIQIAADKQRPAIDGGESLDDARWSSLPF